MEDNLPKRIRDGVRYVAEKKHGKKIREGIKRKRASEKDEDEPTVSAKKLKATYMVLADKFYCTVTKDQLGQELFKEDLGQELTHKILQCRIR